MDIKVPLQQTGERYFQVLQNVVLAPSEEGLEADLSAAFELGREMVDQGVPPDEVTYIHHDAIVRLSLAHPLLVLSQIADRLTMPLMEMSKAYGMGFRELMDRRYHTMVNTRLEKSHKLEALGTLAAGVAHDFNNLLGSIVGYAELAGDELVEGSTGRNCIGQVLTASFRARDIVARLLTFAKQDSFKPELTEIVFQTRETLALLSVSFKPDLNFQFNPGIDQAMVMADTGQLQRVVMNLCFNAADAMNNKGIVVVSINSVWLDDSIQPGGKPGICIEVADSGHGMTASVQERIFDPFFTTKAPNKGSGLGLSVVYGIVTQLGGAIDVRSRATGSKRGTEIRVLLPLSEDHSFQQTFDLAEKI